MKFFTRSVLVQVILILLISISCTNQTQIENKEEQKLSVKDIIAKHSNYLMAIDGVEGLYESADDDGNPIIKIMASAEDDDLISSLPDTLEGFKVVVVVTGKIEPL